MMANDWVKRLLSSLFVIATFLFLLALGTWQMQRLAWKTELIKSIDQGLNAEAVDVDDEKTYREYSHVRVAGVYDGAGEFYVHAINAEGKPGFHIYTLLRREGLKAVMVNRGFVAPEVVKSGEIKNMLPIGVQVLTGVLRHSHDKKYFIPENDIANNRWFYAHLPSMASALEIKSDDIFPQFLELDKSAANDNAPQAGVTRVDIVNNHLSYAVTWYGLALALLVVVLIYQRGRRKQQKD